MQLKFKILSFLLLIVTGQIIIGQTISDIQKKEALYYKIVDVPIPKEVLLEVGGLALTDKNQLGVSTRRGEVWVIDNPNSTSPTYNRYAHGLHEPLGLGYRNNGFYLAQRGELTRLEDTDGDGEADLYKTVFSWPLSGNYHEYSYGPKFMDNGDMIVTLNLGWQGRGVSLVKWRGWMLKITPEGEMTPIATGLRSPAGFGINDQGDLFYTENQGDWVGSGRMTHLESGDFAGNPAGLRWTDDPQSPLKLKPEDIEKKSGLSLYEYAKKIPNLKAPAIWFPHTILGVSTSDILIDTNAGKFGPFDGQMFVGDQGQSKIMRVFMEKVNGVYQGVTFDFVEGFSSGVLRMIWGANSNMFVGMTSRGWGSTGKDPYGLQRLVWTGKTPFEIKTVKALDDGFLIEFTKPVNLKTASKTASYEIKTFTYHYHNTYGSDIVDQQNGLVEKAEVSKDGLSAKLTIQGMRLGFIHQIKIPGVKSANGEKLLHNTGYYTLNEVPGGVLKSPQTTNMLNAVTKIKQPKRVIEMPITWAATWKNEVDKKVVIATKPGLKYDVEELEVKRGSKLEITFNNNDDMLHNLVVVLPGTIDKVADMALNLGLKGPDYNYVPDSDFVLNHTAILQPGTSETIYVQIPWTRGEYWIVCTFPGHSKTMRIRLTVK